MPFEKDCGSSGRAHALHSEGPGFNLWHPQTVLGKSGELLLETKTWDLLHSPFRPASRFRCQKGNSKGVGGRWEGTENMELMLFYNLLQHSSIIAVPEQLTRGLLTPCSLWSVVHFPVFAETCLLNYSTSCYFYSLGERLCLFTATGTDALTTMTCSLSN